MKIDIPVAVRVVGTHGKADNIVEVGKPIDANGGLVLPIRVPASLCDVIDFDGDERKWILVYRDFCD